MTDEIKEKLEFYLTKAEPLFRELKAQPPKNMKWDKMQGEFLQMTLGYYNDALHFRDKGEYLMALLALEYAEGWLDAGKRIGLFK